jgi:N,N'-diacetylchitobiose transport system permease protein
VPYWLILPVLVAMAAILGYPLYKLVTLAFQQYGLPELIQRKGVWIGLDNFESVLRDSIFWDVLIRTVIFTFANVALTMVIGTLLALLLVKISTWVRVLLTTGLVLVWAMPAVVAVQVFFWMTNFQNGILNYVLTQLGFGDYFQHDWYATTLSKLAMVTLLIVWGAIPFVTISVYAALTQVPRDLVDAAEVDGAGAWSRFRHVTLPGLRHVIIVTFVLSFILTINDFNIVYVMTRGDAGTEVIAERMIRWFFRFDNDGRGAAIAVFLFLAALPVVIADVRRARREGLA